MKGSLYVLEHFGQVFIADTTQRTQLKGNLAGSVFIKRRT